MKYAKKLFKIAIIGCGKIAEKHALLLKSKQLKHFNLEAVCDTNKNKSKNFGKKYNVNYFFNLDDLLKSTNVDIIVICTSSGYHYSNALTVSKYKKHIIIEKPISLNIESAKKIVKIYSKINKKLFVVMQNRLNPLINLLSEVIKKKILGKISSVSVRVWWCRDQNYYDQANWRGTWKFDGGIFMNQGIHHLDLMTWLIGPVKSINAMIKRRLVKIESEDFGSATLEFKNGVIGNIEVSTALRPKNLENSITVLGENGNIQIGGLYMNELKIYDLKNKKLANSILKKYKNKKSKNNHHLFYEHVSQNLIKKKTNQEMIIDGKEALKSLEIVTGIYKSVISKKRVYFPIQSQYRIKENKLLFELKK